MNTGAEYGAEYADAGYQPAGGGAEAQPQRLGRLRAQTTVLNGVAGGATLCMILRPGYPWLVVAVAALPWAALMLAAGSGGTVRLARAKRDGQPAVDWAFFAPGIGLAMRASEQVHALSLRPLLTLSLVLGAVLATGALAADPQLRRWIRGALAAVLCSCAWGYGAGLQANALMDQSEATHYAALVLARHESHGRSTTWYLRLGPWGPGEQQSGDVSVPRALYVSVQEGDTVCLPVRRGALGVAWFRVEKCN